MPIYYIKRFRQILYFGHSVIVPITLSFLANHKYFYIGPGVQEMITRYVILWVGGVHNLIKLQATPCPNQRPILRARAPSYTRNASG